MNIQAKKVLILYFKNMTVGDYRVVLDYADMPLLNFVIEYLRKNEKFRETVFVCSYSMWPASLLSKGRGRKSVPLRTTKMFTKTYFYYHNLTLLWILHSGGTEIRTHVLWASILLAPSPGPPF